MGHDHAEFLRRFTPIQQNLFAFVRAAGFSWNEAEDLLQEIAVALWESYERYDAERPFIAWALGVGRNQVLKRRRQLAGGRTLVDSDVCIKIAERLSETLEKQQQQMAQEREHLAECLNKMPLEMRNALGWRYRERMPLSKIAERVGRSYAATNMWLSRLRGKLLECVSAARQETRI